MTNLRAIVLSTVLLAGFLSQGCMPNLSTDVGRGPSDTTRPLPPVEGVRRDFYAVLVVESIPSGAQVFLNEALRGVTPTRIGAITPGSYSVRLSAPGYRDYHRNVFLQEGEVYPFQAKLTPQDTKLDQKEYTTN